MKSLSLAIVLLAFSFISLNVNAQTPGSDNVNQTLTMGISEICLISNDGSDVSLDLTTTTAGDTISGGTGTAYTQVSSIVPSGETRSISASVDQVPTGTQLYVTTSNPTNGNQGGVLGTSSGRKELTSTATTLHTGIGSCYTGTGATDGFAYFYEWEVNTGSYGSITATSGVTATVTITLTDM